MTLLIDADWLIYNSCCACEQDTRWNDWEHTLHSDEREILNLIENRLDVYRTIADSKHDIVMCFTSLITLLSASGLRLPILLILYSGNISCRNVG